MERKEVIKIIQDLYKVHKKLSTVGIILRDKYLLLSIRKEFNSTLKDLFLEGNSNFLDDSIVINIQRCLALRNHLKLNKKDLHNKRIFDLYQNKLFRFIFYHKKKSDSLNKLKKINLETLEILLNKYFLV